MCIILVKTKVKKMKKTYAVRTEEKKKRYNIVMHPSIMKILDTLANEYGTSRSSILEFMLKHDFEDMKKYKSDK